ncbi:MAG TPA: alpha/beta fold hydrolase [Streptomyces sp.]|nr:alpha/beta fold hydrolase [Streptomyces sp.]
MDRPPEFVGIPYEDTSLPGYLYPAADDGTGTPRPLVIHHGGIDSTLGEGWFFVAAATLARGYDCLCSEGPGQDSVLRDHGLVFRPDWERVVTPVVDYALDLPGVDPDRVVLMGTSLGGLLAVRAAAFEHRLAGCVAHDAVWQLGDVVALPPVRAGVGRAGLRRLRRPAGGGGRDAADGRSRGAGEAPCAGGR